MNGVNSCQELPLKRQRRDMAGAPSFYTRITTCAGGSSSSSGGAIAMPQKLLCLSIADADVVDASTVVPPVTVVLEGRSICHRIHLTRLAGYQSFAVALRRMFVYKDDHDDNPSIGNLDLSNAVPGHLVAYEDMEDDLLLAGDLTWKDFVRVAKRIRIIPSKASGRKYRG